MTPPLSTERRGGGPAGEVVRFSLQVRVQRILLSACTLLLILTGFGLWFLGRPEWMPFDRAALTGWYSLNVVRVIHRVAGGALVLLCVYHVFWVLLSREGRREFRLLLPRGGDFRDFRENILYFLGKREQGPAFGRYPYFEKFDYWGAYWGCALMIVTGLVMWFDRLAAQVFPGFPYKLAATIHMYEAILATLVHLTWDVYHLYLRPGGTRGAKVLLTGRMSREEMAEEHPLELAGPADSASS